MTTTPTTDHSGSPVLADGWWAPALALHERPPGAEPPDRSPNDVARARLDRWRQRHGPAGATALRRRLADLGLDEQELLALLGEPPTALAARTERPDWARTVEQAVRSAPTHPAGAAVPTRWRPAFARIVRPLVTTAVARLDARLAPYRDADWLDLPSVLRHARAQLGHRLVDLAAPTLVAELHARRDAGRLRGADGRRRFADFVRQLRQPAGLGDLFTRYPVLARLLAQTSRYETDALARTVTRFAADRAEVVRVLLGGVAPGRLCAISAGRGDPHQRGDHVRVLRFATGRRVVHKPRGVDAQRCLNALLDWLNRTAGLGLRTPTVLAASGYGWMEYLTCAPLPGPDAAGGYYRRLGALLALLHVVHATDMHCENLVAVADQPVVLDAETLSHPVLPGAYPTDGALGLLARSVARTAMLPSVAVGAQPVVDMSALAGRTGSAAVRWAAGGTDRMRPDGRDPYLVPGPSRPRLAGRAVEPAAFRADLLDGFRRAYQAVTGDRQGLLDVLRRHAHVDLRVVVRPTQRYRTLIEEANQPALLRDALDREPVFDLLWLEADDPLRRAVARYELADLWAGDVPLFHTRPGSRDLWTSTGQRLPDRLADTVADQVTQTVHRLGDTDRHHQEWLVAATLALRRHTPVHRAAEPLTGPLAPVVATPQRLRAAAGTVADRIVAAGVFDGDRIEWLGLEPVDDQHWLILPAGAGLAHGSLGVALFLAQYARTTGESRYADVARRSTHTLHRLGELLAGQPHLAAAVGCGGLSGLGGMAYGLARLAGLLDDPGLAVLAERTVALTAGVLAQAPPYWRDGLAGCLAAMLAVCDELGLPAAGRLAERCADLLVSFLSSADPTDLADDFTTGWAGVAHALDRVARRLPRFRSPADRAWSLATASPPRSRPRGWCHGAAGRLAAMAAGERLAAPGHPDTLRPEVRALLDAPVCRDLSLCHGELGVTEAVAVLAATGDRPASQARDLRAGLLLAALDRYGPLCATPDGVPTPGLLAGLAGIGYGLLRLDVTARVPSVLLLEPTPVGQ